MKKSGLKHLRVFSRNIPYHNFGNGLDVVFFIKRRIIFFFKHKKRENANNQNFYKFSTPSDKKRLKLPIINYRPCMF